MTLVQYIKLVTLVMTGLSVALFPSAIMRQGRRPSAWFAVAAAEVMLFGEMAAISEHFDEQVIKWYRTPVAFVSSSLYLTFIYLSYLERRNIR